MSEQEAINQFATSVVLMRDSIEAWYREHPEKRSEAENWYREAKERIKEEGKQ